ncbi:hypothetical protein GCM10027168_39660 [Streptomyces capparidis]
MSRACPGGARTRPGRTDPAASTTSTAGSPRPPGLDCALAEALLGPGRYFGREWHAFKDCLAGGFGVAPPFTLVWHDSQIARRALADVVEDPEGRLSYFEEIVRLLQRCGVTLALR